MTIKNLFISGTPGVGKTTLIKESIIPFRDRVMGFLTEESQKGAARHSFLLKRLSSPSTPAVEGIFASKDFKNLPRVGKYGVDLHVLETIGLPSMEEALHTPNRLLVIDEIGSMEILSTVFREKLFMCLQTARLPVLATIRHQSQPFTDHIKRLENSKLIHLTRNNRTDVKTRVRQWMNEKLP